MGMLFCYSVFGRRSKMSKTVPVLEAPKTGLRATRKVHLESNNSPASELVMFKGMDEYVAAVTDMSRGNETRQDVGPQLVIDCSALVDPFPNEELGSEKGANSAEKLDVTETVVDIDKLSSVQDSDSNLQQFHDDLGRCCYETHMWSSCSQRTFQGEVSLSVGEGTFSSDGRQELLHQQDGECAGASRDVREDASSGGSVGECCNRSSHGHEFHDGYSAEGGRVSKGFAFDAQYSDDGAQVLLNQPFAQSEVVDCLDGAHLFSEVDGHMHHDKEEYSGHASDPGFYASEILNLSPGEPEDGSISPPMDVKGSTCLQFAAVRDAGEGALVEAADGKVGSMPQISSELRHSNRGVLHDDMESSLSRVKEWVNSIQQSDMDFGGEEEGFVASDKGSSSVELHPNEACDASVALHSVDHSNVDHVFANTAVRSLHPSSTVAHISGIGLREAPSLGMFSSLRALNLSANLIAHVPVGCLPRSLHSLDLSRNRIAQIEGFRELTRLRVLNLSYNRISRIGHGLANCTLIKELYLAGNKIGEVEGLHRLLKLAVLDLSFNKLTTSKALGQLAANYGSLLALNLLGNPILTNFSEDQMRKLVTALAPHVTYLNRQPIKMISVREAALDSVARAALGTSQRHSKSRDVKTVRKPSGAQPGLIKKKPPPHQHSRHSDKKLAAAASSGHHHHHHGKTSVSGQGTEHMPSLKELGGFQNIALESGKRSMPRSRSAGVLQE